MGDLTDFLEDTVSVVTLGTVDDVFGRKEAERAQDRATRVQAQAAGAQGEAFLEAGDIQAQAAIDAARAGERGIGQALGTTQQAGLAAQQQLQPFTGAGVSALDQQLALLGLPPSQQAPPPQQQQVFGGPAADSSALGRPIAFDRPFTPSVSPKLGGLPAAPSGVPGESSIRSQLPNKAPLEGDFIPAAAPQGAPQLTPQGAPQLTPQQRQEQAFAAFNESPGQRFIRDRQERSLLRNASAIGGLGGGNVRTALQEQAAGFAQQDFQNQLDRLSQLSRSGQQAATTGAQFGLGTGGDIANLQQQIGQVRGQGILGEAAGLAGGLTGEAGAVRDIAAIQAAGTLGKQQSQAALTGQILGLGGTIAGSFIGAPRAPVPVAA